MTSFQCDRRDASIGAMMPESTHLRMVSVQGWVRSASKPLRIFTSASSSSAKKAKSGGSPCFSIYSGNRSGIS